MIRHVSYILLREWSITSQWLWVYRISFPYAQKDPKFLFEKRRGQPWEFWSLVSTKMVVHYPRTVWKDSYDEHKVNGETYTKNTSSVLVHWLLSFTLTTVVKIQTLKWQPCSRL